jgi:hypothetical protein
MTEEKYKDRRLTAKQEAFAWDIANKTYDFIWQAYAASYDIKKMSQNAIYVESCRLLQNPKVSLRVKEIEDKIKEQEVIKLDEILVKLSNRVNLDIREMFDDNGTMKSIKELTKDQAMFISSFDVSEIWGTVNKSRQQIGELKKVKMESIKDMLDMLIRVYGGYAKDKEEKSDLQEIKEIIEAAKR